MGTESLLSIWDGSDECGYFLGMRKKNGDGQKGR